MKSNKFGEVAFETVTAMVGGDAKAYWVSEMTVAMVWAECQKNETIKTLALRYLAGDFQFADKNLANLKAELAKTFGLAEVA